MNERVRDWFHLTAARWTVWNTAEVVLSLGFGLLFAALWGR